MTVLELIENLQKMDADAKVMLSATDIGWEPVEVLTIEGSIVVLSTD